MLLVDTNVLLDIVEHDPEWRDWSAEHLRNQKTVHELVISPVVYAELAPSFSSLQKLDSEVQLIGLRFRDLPKSALFLAGIAHRQYRRAGGARESILADFLLGAHAMVLGCGILTRDARRFRNYFPRVPLVSP
ncbi:MAG: type II toxin-antitoxin system VapC family toxin [Pseudomonadota bacterium]